MCGQLWEIPGLASYIYIAHPGNVCMSIGSPAHTDQHTTNTQPRKPMDKTAKTANAFITVSVLLSFIPIFGSVGYVTLLVAGILSIVAIAKEQKGGVRVLVSSLLAAPLMFVINMVMIAWVTGA